MGKFDKFLEAEETKETYVSLQRKKELQQTQKPKRKAKTTGSSLKSVKMTEETYQILTFLKMSTRKKYLEILDEAMSMYADAEARSNQNFRAMRAMLRETNEVAKGQTTIEDFLEK
ncbi:hypothetical protein SAMN02745116_00353 [Pilibacter termitis]|uniref:Uncharacterized protein n=1 Tax=Pilibacter termitis TaxID=263852 RepID=A0A1T4KRX3_9ENTE|nr:hypothetical protein [Pilibacter termitis]SJZ45123.1 hypothetical protein SAMN02745116_00353 [Pilibacter termitis]